MHSLYTRSHAPETASRPFVLERDGFIAEECSGTLILEDLEHAKERGAKIYAEVVGGGMSADAHHITATHPEGLGAKMAMRAALEDARMNVNDIDYINVHGTSTPIGDPQEIKDIVTWFGERAFEIYISYKTSMTGNLRWSDAACKTISYK